MIVKICGITNREDATVAVEAGASSIGFNFYPPSPRAISVETARELAAGWPAGILKVGVFVGEAPATIARTMSEAGLDIAQVIGESPTGVRTWKVLRVDAGFSADRLDDPAAEAFLLDAPSASLYGGTGHAFDWSRAKIGGKKIVIAGGLGPDNIVAAIEMCRPWGVDACSRLESSPGRKDPEKVKAFIAAALSV
jgi:phosphoribosylanthranilate isomerase